MNTTKQYVSSDFKRGCACRAMLEPSSRSSRKNAIAPQMMARRNCARCSWRTMRRSICTTRLRRRRYTCLRDGTMQPFRSPRACSFEWSCVRTLMPIWFGLVGQAESALQSVCGLVCECEELDCMHWGWAMQLTM